MTVTQWALLAAVALPWLAALAIFALGEARERSRTLVGAGAALGSSAAAILVGRDVAAGVGATVGLPLLGSTFGLSADRLGVLFAVVASVLWLLTTVYATGYLSHGRDRARFFGFFAICVGSAVGIAFSANLLTLFVFYEALTLATYPLVVHSGTAAAIRGGRTYLYYALTGGVLLAVGVIWLSAIGGSVDFSDGPVSPAFLASYSTEMTVVFVLLMAGFGVKAALFPAHGWLPAAMVAPAPVSALLHAVAVVKAGVFGIARVVLDVYGIEGAASLGVLGPLAGLASFTLLFASVKALAQDDIKKRLAYSTIGQLSYIVLGLALGSPLAAAAGLAHLAHHAVLKITMFFTAGVLAEELKVYRVSRMDGVGRRMPVTMTAFSVAALGIIGVPPIAGFVGKWGLLQGGLDSGGAWPLAVLGVSTLLNAAYFLPMLGRAWFGTPDAGRAGEGGHASPRRFEGDRRMVLPLALTATLGLAAGPLAALPFAPATWAALTAGVPPARLVPWSAGGFALDSPGRLFLAVALVVWACAFLAGMRAGGSGRARLAAFASLAAGGSVVLAFAAGPAEFYAAFSVMALSAYGLVVHGGSTREHSAGRAYLSFTLLGEALLLSGLVLGASDTQGFSAALLASPWRDAGIGLLVAAFGIKVGAPLLGGWMPATYAALGRGWGAAVAGVVSTGGVLGLVRFAPGGIADLAGWGTGLMAAGLVAAFFGAAAGLVQRCPRHVLAYSSMSQFGLMTVGVGVGLANAEAWPAAVAAVGVYAAHHGFAKAALFLSDDAVADVSPRRRAALALLPALALAGLPLTSGAVAKVALKGVAAQAPGVWEGRLETLLPLAAVGTTLLMARFLFLLAGAERRPGSGSGARAVAALGVVLAFTAGYTWLSGDEAAAYAAAKSLSPEYLLVLSWPVALGAVIALAAWAGRRWVPRRVIGVVPPGDVWARPLAWLDDRWTRYQDALSGETAPAERPGADLGAGTLLDAAARLETRLLTWPVAAGGLVVIAIVMLVLTL